MQRVVDFLKKAGTYYFATVEDGCPRVRPFGTCNVYEGRLYIQTGKGKPVFQQIESNNHVELCAMVGQEWLRLSGELIRDDSVAAQESMLDAYPELRSMYTTGENGNTVVYFFKNAKAVIASFVKGIEISF